MSRCWGISLVSQTTSALSCVTSGFSHTSIMAFCRDSRKTADGLAVSEEHDCRNRANSESLGGSRALVHVNFDDTQPPGVFRGHGVDHGAHEATWRAPCRPEIYEHEPGIVSFDCGGRGDVIHRDNV